MHPLISRLDFWLSSNHPDFYRCLLPGLSDSELEEFSASLGVRLPTTFRQLYAWRNGQSPQWPGTFLDGYSLMTLEQIRFACSTLNSIHSDLIREQLPGRDTWWNPQWIPFLDGGGDYLCVDCAGTLGGTPGQLVSFVHDDSSRTIDYPSLDKWLEVLVESLELGMWQVSEYNLLSEPLNQFAGFTQVKNPGYPVVVHSAID